MKNTFWWLWFVGLFGIIGCSEVPSESSDRLQLLCTTGMIGDALQEIAGPHADVISLMGPGVDPHLYKATQGDLKYLTGSDAIFYNGLHLEGKMVDVLKKVGRTKPVVAFADGLGESSLINITDFADGFDPHIWFDVARWATAISYASTELQKIDPVNAIDYQARTESYLNRLDSLNQAVKEEVASIPKSQRVLITAHDAFAYFGNAYEIEVRGLQGISTVSEYGLRDISDLVNFITNRNIKAVFVESSVPRKSLEAVVEGCKKRGHEVQIGGTLYSDAMGGEGSGADSYIGMVDANVRTIVSSLK